MIGWFSVVFHCGERQGCKVGSSARMVCVLLHMLLAPGPGRSGRTGVPMRSAGFWVVCLVEETTRTSSLLLLGVFLLLWADRLLLVE